MQKRLWRPPRARPPKRLLRSVTADHCQGCFKIGVLRPPGWEAAVGDGFAGPPPYTAPRRLGRLAIADSQGLTCRLTPARL